MKKIRIKLTNIHKNIKSKQKFNTNVELTQVTNGKKKRLHETR